MPTEGDSAAVSSQALQSLQSRDFVWSQQVFPSRALPRGDTKHHPLQSGCELSSSPRVQGGAGQPLDRHTFAWTAPPLAEGGEKRRPGQTSPTVGSGAVCTMAWTPLLLVLLSHCTGRDRTQGRGLSSQIILFLLHLLRSFPWFCPITDTCLCLQVPSPSLC